MEQSILTSTKKILGLDAEYTAFDLDVITHINAVFGTLNQIGIGPTDGFFITDDTSVWEDFLDGDASITNVVKTYTYLKVRMLFDPPTTSYLLAATNEQIEQLEWRLNVMREDLEWTPPT